MEFIPRLRTDALLYWADFEKQVEAETDPIRRTFFNFIAAQSLNAVSGLGDDVVLDMRGIAALASRILDRQKHLLGILSGAIGEEDWSS